MAAPLDGLRLADGALAVNMVVSGTAPGRLRAWHRRWPCVVLVDEHEVFRGSATTVVVANGQFLDGDDVVPKGHPGDGRFEVQVYSVAPGQRRAVRRRLLTGTHLPHPEIRTFQGRSARVTWGAPMPLRLDRRRPAAVAEVEVTLVPAAFSILL
jgi:diacylglycerol kinase family enzyme